MKAITLWQPGASALFTDSLKPDETFSWPMPAALAGREIAIHAAKRWTIQERKTWLWLSTPPVLRQFREIGITGSNELPRGAIIGIITFAPSIRTQDIRDHRETDQRAWGDYTAGRWAWPVRTKRLLPAPVPFTGRQGFFDWTP